MVDNIGEADAAAKRWPPAILRFRAACLDSLATEEAALKAEMDRL